MPDNTELNSTGLKERLRDAARIYAMYGTFDPFTAQHQAILRELLLRATLRIVNSDSRDIPEILIIVQNSSASSSPDSPGLAHRAKMAEKAAYIETCPAIYHAMADHISVVEAGDSSLCDTLKETLGVDLGRTYIAMPAEQWTSQASRVTIGEKLGWMYWHDLNSALVREASFMVFRDSDKEVGQCAEGVRMVVQPEPVPEVTEADVRKAMKFDPLYRGTDVPAYIRDHIVSNGLYSQVMPSELERENNTAAQEHNARKHPKYPLTVTVVAFCYGNVLLVRRKEAPYRTFLSLPSAPVKPGEAVEDTAVRIMKDVAGPHVPACQARTLGVYTREGTGGYDVGMGVGADTIGLVMAKEGDIQWEWVPVKDALKARLAFHHGRILKEFNSRFPDGMGDTVRIVGL